MEAETRTDIQQIANKSTHVVKSLVLLFSLITPFAFKITPGNACLHQQQMTDTEAWTSHWSVHTAKALTLVYLPTIVPAGSFTDLFLQVFFFFYLFVYVLASFVGHPAEPLYSVLPLPNCGTGSMCWESWGWRGSMKLQIASHDSWLFVFGVTGSPWFKTRARFEVKLR